MPDVRATPGCWDRPVHPGLVAREKEEVVGYRREVLEHYIINAIRIQPPIAGEACSCGVRPSRARMIRQASRSETRSG